MKLPYVKPAARPFYLTFIPWIIVTEITAYGSVNHWHANPWLALNAYLFIGIVGFMWLVALAYWWTDSI